MRVLVTGNLGYIGTVLSQDLSARGYSVQGLDAGFFQHCLIGPAPADPPTLFKDVRDIEAVDVDGCDAVVHLAALSNDPLGELSPNLTEEINRDATIRSAEVARNSGVKRFIYVSSQSMYGIAELDEELDEDESDKRPMTVYARTKWEAEQELQRMTGDGFGVVCFRPSTVFGFSPRQRCDIVFNSLLGSGLFEGQVRVNSDGTPWRPVIHVRDVSRAIIAGLEHALEGNEMLTLNIGLPNGNYQVSHLAEVSADLTRAGEVNYGSQLGGDERSYKVSFRKFDSTMPQIFHSMTSLRDGGKEMIDKWLEHGMTTEQFRGEATHRLLHLQALISSGELCSETLRWVSVR
jgi:nucleoside-diphosphate-sugar epimerase